MTAILVQDQLPAPESIYGEKLLYWRDLTVIQSACVPSKASWTSSLSIFFA